MRFIKHITEPQRLVLVWQPPQDASSRIRRAVGELLNKNGKITFRYLTDTEDYNAALELGFLSYPAFKKTKPIQEENVLEVFLQRIPPRKRSDFGEYLEKFRISRDAKISDFALLGYTEAKLPGDGFSIINPYETLEGPAEFLSEIAGFRHYAGMDKSFLDISIGNRLRFLPEPDNQYDANAVKIYSKEKLIGYVNRIQAPAFKKWISSGIVSASIERISGQHDRPQVYMFVSVKASQPS